MWCPACVGFVTTDGERRSSSRFSVADCQIKHRHNRQIYTNICSLWYGQIVKLSVWAKREGIHYMTAWRWWRNGKLPVPAYQAPSGSVIISLPEDRGGRTAVYARVSAYDQTKDLDRQVTRVTTWATTQGQRVDQVVTEVGSGLTGKRRKLLRMLANPEMTTIIVENRDRLARFGFDAIKAALDAQGRRLLVADSAEPSDDLRRDMIEILTAFCAHLYGRRGARSRATAAVNAAKSVTV